METIYCNQSKDNFVIHIKPRVGIRLTLFRSTIINIYYLIRILHMIQNIHLPHKDHGAIVRNIRQSHEKTRECYLSCKMKIHCIKCHLILFSALPPTILFTFTYRFWIINDATIQCNFTISIEVINELLANLLLPPHTCIYDCFH